MPIFVVYVMPSVYEVMAFSPGGWVCADSTLRKAEVESFLAKMKVIIL